MKQEIVGTSPEDTAHENIIGLPWNSSQYSNDVLEYKVPNASKSATMEGVLFWPKNLATNLYEIPLDISGLQSLTVSRISYVVGYLERATLLSFRQPRVGDTTIVKVLERSGDKCWSSVGKAMGRGYVYMNLHPAVCTTLHMYLHEFMHLLGFVHEHERPDAQSHYYNRLPNPVNLSYFTEFDSFSVMNYPRHAIGDLINPWLNEVSKGRRTFLSRCDWSLLLSVYPGKNVAPQCIPNYAPNVLVPSEKLLKSYSQDRSYYLCQYNNEWLYETGYCVTANKKQYPNLSTELGFMANEYSNKRLRSSVYDVNVPPIPESSIDFDVQRKQDNTTYNTLLNQTLPQEAVYASFDKETCLLIYNALAETLFVENCGPSGDEVCKEVSSTEDLRIWLKENYAQCLRPKSNKNLENSTHVNKSH